MANRRRPRHGVLLLVVLSILVLFVLSGLTFVVVAGHYRRGAVAYARHELTGDYPQTELDRAMYQLLRGTRDRDSVLLGHDLLNDLYGNDGVRGIVTAVREDVGASFLRINVTADRGHVLSDFPTYHNGAVLTMLDGPEAGNTTRIVDYRPGEIALEWSANDSSRNVLPVRGNHFLINGRPFNGTGFGYNPATAQLDLALDQAPVALLPNFSAYRVDVPFDLGGADESWEAADYQNMFLAFPGRVPILTAVCGFHRHLNRHEAFR